MTKKDYQIIATTIKYQFPFGYEMLNKEMIVELNTEEKVSVQTLWKLANELSEQLAKDNPKFDRNKFIQACGFWV